MASDCDCVVAYMHRALAGIARSTHHLHRKCNFPRRSPQGRRPLVQAQRQVDIIDVIWVCMMSQ